MKWKLLQNCPIHFQDVVNAWKIYGEDLGAVCGKTVRTQSPVVNTDEIVKVPQELLMHLQDVTLCADVMFMDKMVLLTTYSRRIGFTTIDFIKSTSMEDIHEALKRVFGMYKNRKVPVKYLSTDRQFLPLEDNLLQEDDVILNATSAAEHVPDVERNIRSIKERNRASSAGLPYKILPKLMKIAKAKMNAFWLNLFPREGTITNLLGPRLLLLGDLPDYNKICQIPFGAYCEVFDNPDPSNTSKSRTTPAIALCPANNLQGSYYFLSMNTWKILCQRQWTEMPLTPALIEQVENKGKRDAGLQPGDDIPEQFIFKYIDGTLVGVDIDETHTNNQGGIAQSSNHLNDEDESYTNYIGDEDSHDQLDPEPFNGQDDEVSIGNTSSTSFNDNSKNNQIQQETNIPTTVNSNNTNHPLQQETQAENVEEEKTQPSLEERTYNTRGNSSDYTYRYGMEEGQNLNIIHSLQHETSPSKEGKSS